MFNSTRRLLLPAIDRVKRALFGGYAVSDSTEDEYALTVTESLSAVEECLAAAGFAQSLTSALKVRVDGNVADGSWVYREAPWADEQLHLVLHEGDGDWVDVYAHTELSPIRHPIAHYRTVGYSATEGIERTHDLFEASDLDCEVNPRYRRDEKWFLYGLYLVSKPAARRARSLIDASYDYLPMERSQGKPNLPFMVDEYDP